MDDPINRKRKINGQDFQIPQPKFVLTEDDKNFLTLSTPQPPPQPRKIGGSWPHAPPPNPTSDPPLALPIQPVDPHPTQPPPPSGGGISARPVRARRNPSQAPKQAGKADTVLPPYPWATNKRATVHSLQTLRAMQITTISGQVQCKRCEKQYDMELDLEAKFGEVGAYIRCNKDSMRERAPVQWLNPNLPACRLCGAENSVKPIVSDKKKGINWLFLLLGQMLGCCTLDQLKYFCKHTKNHRTGAKDRVLYLTYLALCKQLDPTGPYDR